MTSHSRRKRSTVKCPQSEQTKLTDFFEKVKREKNAPNLRVFVDHNNVRVVRFIPDTVKNDNHNTQEVPDSSFEFLQLQEAEVLLDNDEIKIVKFKDEEDCDTPDSTGSGEPDHYELLEKYRQEM